MTAPVERAYFKWHAQEIFTGRGAVVDLGSWFGSTTVMLALGLSKNPRMQARLTSVHAFDRYIWEPWMEPYAWPVQSEQYSPGDSFIQEFERFVAPWRASIQVHVGDLCHQRWTGEPIELLLVDAMKSWTVSRCILTSFFRWLIPGGYVIHQDFANCWTPWIHLTGYRLREHLVPVQDVPQSETVVFKVVNSMELEEAGFDLSRRDFDESEISRGFEYSLRIAGREKHSGIYAAWAMIFVYDGDLVTARRMLEALERQGRVNAFHADALRGAIERGQDSPD